MQYSATFKHIDKDFGCEKLSDGEWSEVYENDEDLIVALNRMAITSSQDILAEFPEVEVSAKYARVTIRAIEGRLYYTDFHSQNRKDMELIASEIVGLIQGKPLSIDSSVSDLDDDIEGDDDAYVLPSIEKKKGPSLVAKLFALVVMLGVLWFCSKLIWEDLTQERRMYSVPKFYPSLSGERNVLQKYADVYVNGLREGAMLFELTREGLLTRYEMWFSTDQEAYILIPIDTYEVQVGMHEGKTAILAGEYHLLELVGDENITLHGVKYGRHHSGLSSIGEVLDAARK